MADVTELIKGLANPVEQRSLVRGYISTSRPAPTGFTTVGSEANYVWVIVPKHSTEVPYGPCNWAALHGTSLPAQGAACVVALDQINKPVIVWWEGAQSPLVVSALPASPTDGQTIYFQNTAMGEAGVMWTLRYRAASASTHKWEFVGGPPWGSAYSGEKVAKVTEAEEELPSGPKLTVPINGDYELAFTDQVVTLNVAGAMNMNVIIRANGVPQITAVYIASAQFAGGTLSSDGKISSLLAGEVLSIGISQNAVKSATYLTARISMQPVRVG